MKKQFIFYLSLVGLSLSACIDNLMPSEPSTNEGILSIESFYPESAIGGSEIAIYGKNFGATIRNNYVTFNYNGSDEKQTGWASELILMPHTDMVLVRLPQHLYPGEYTISLHANGKTCHSKKPFRIINANSSGI